jgi:8-oxo-dGTP diphosphatase
MSHELQSDGRVHGVVFGCRREDGRWLMVRRSRHVAILPLRVCFPGGGAMVCESLETACIREAREELGISITPVKQVWRHEFTDRPLLLVGFLAEKQPGEIKPDTLEIAEVLWLWKAEPVEHCDGVETNGGFIEALEAALAAD